VWICGNQNHRHLISPPPQRFLQLKPALSGQLQISDQACRLCDHSRLEEALRRCESGGGVAKGLDKLAYAVAGQFLIIKHRDQWSFGHPWSPGRNVSQTKATKSQFVFAKFDLAQCRLAPPNVRFGSKADIAARPVNVRFTPRKRTSVSAIGVQSRTVRFTLN